MGHVRCRGYGPLPGLPPRARRGARASHRPRASRAAQRTCPRAPPPLSAVRHVPGGAGDHTRSRAGGVMPRAPRICATSGCANLTPSGYCTACAARRPARRDIRASASLRGYTARWSRYAAAYRARHPWCRTCAAAGRRRATQAVDHIRPVRGPQDPRFWDPTNHQPLCRSCHAVKTQAEGRTQATRTAPATTPRAWRFA